MLLILNYEGDPFWKSRCLNIYLHQLPLTYTVQIMSKLRPTLNFIFFPFLFSSSCSLPPLPSNCTIITTMILHLSLKFLLKHLCTYKQGAKSITKLIWHFRPTVPVGMVHIKNWGWRENNVLEIASFIEEEFRLLALSSSHQEDCRTVSILEDHVLLQNSSKGEKGAEGWVGKISRSFCLWQSDSSDILKIFLPHKTVRWWKNYNKCKCTAEFTRKYGKSPRAKKEKRMFYNMKQHETCK